MPPPLSSYTIISSHPCLCLNSPSLIPSVSLSPLHFLSPPSIFRQCSNFPHLLLLFSPHIFFVFISLPDTSLPFLLLLHLFTAQLTYIPASRTVEVARLVFTECSQSPVSGSVGHAEKKVSPFILSLSCPAATCQRLSGITSNHSAKLGEINPDSSVFIFKTQMVDS